MASPARNESQPPTRVGFLLIPDFSMMALTNALERLRAAAIEHMQANLEEPVGRDENADVVGLSTRQVERLFMRYLGHSPARYYMELRLKRAHDLLCQTALSVVDVSVACGFVSASHFSKCYREAHGHPPRAERLLHAAE